MRFLVGSFIFSSFIHTLTAGEITGVIGSYFDESGKSYLGVAVEKTLVMTTPGGQTLSSDFPQLAGLDERNHRAAMQLLGRRVTITGRPMERHTVHHRTPVLWIAEKLRLAENDDSSPGRIEEVSRGSALRRELFDLARPHAEKQAGQPVKFEGSMKRMGDWVFFSGNVVDRDGRPIPVHGVASDTVALWRREKDRWRVLDVGAGASDAYHYYVWPEKFGAPVELLRSG